MCTKSRQEAGRDCRRDHRAGVGIVAVAGVEAAVVVKVVGVVEVDRRVGRKPRSRGNSLLEETG